jgi:hypothetical protein
MDINAGDTAWLLASSALVLLMTPGLAFFCGGLTRDDRVRCLPVDVRDHHRGRRCGGGSWPTCRSCRRVRRRKRSGSPVRAPAPTERRSAEGNPRNGPGDGDSPGPRPGADHAPRPDNPGNQGRRRRKAECVAAGHWARNQRPRRSATARQGPGPPSPSAAMTGACFMACDTVCDERIHVRRQLAGDVPGSDGTVSASVVRRRRRRADPARMPSIHTSLLTAMTAGLGQTPLG